MSLVSGIQYSTEITGRKNAFINGNFDIWQRGTSQTTILVQSADRWGMYLAGTSVTQTMSQQPFTLGQTDVPNNPAYYVRHVVTAGTDVATQARMFQAIEGVRSFSGETVTISFWAKTSAPQNIAFVAYQGFGTGGSPSAEVDTGLDATISTTTSWAKYEVTVAIPSISGKTLGTNGDDILSINFWFSAGSNFNTITNSLGIQTGTFEIAQIQIEKGDVATEFERRSYGEELALCQRYYWQGELEGRGYGKQYSTAGAALSYVGAANFPVTMRAAPTLATITASNSDNVGTLTLVGQYTEGFVLRGTVTATGQYRSYTGVYSADAEY